MSDGAFSDTSARAADIAGSVGHRVRRVLDFGAGEGHLVAAFRSLGVIADGVETSAAARDQARRQYGIELGHALELGGHERYDLIVLQHSLEHVAHPVVVLRQLAGLLDPRGSMIIEVPNASSFEMLRPSRRKSILDLPVHLYHFTPRTLSDVLAAAGLRTVRVSLTNPDWLEWLFAFRAVGHEAGDKAEESSPLGAVPPILAPRFSRRAWRERVLPAVQRWSPGWRFRVLAHRA
jgi:SAM-dependent methyltransferase